MEPVIIKQGFALWWHFRKYVELTLSNKKKQFRGYTSLSQRCTANCCHTTPVWLGCLERIIYFRAELLQFRRNVILKVFSVFAFIPFLNSLFSPCHVFIQISHLYLSLPSHMLFFLLTLSLPATPNPHFPFCPSWFLDFSAFPSFNFPGDDWSSVFIERRLDN